MNQIGISVRSHQWTYQELAESIKDALMYFGFDAEIVYGKEYEHRDFNFYTGGAGNDNFKPEGISIFYETDHIDTPLRKRRPINYKLYTRSLHWFDYKKDLTTDNIHYCPIGYSKHFDTHLPREDLRPVFHMGRDGGLGFRKAFRARHNLWTTSSYTTIGEERDELIVTSKVNVNSRLEKVYWFTPLHAALIIHKGKLYMQEDHGQDDYNWYKPYMVLFTEDNFMKQLDYWVSHDKERREFEKFVHEEVKKNHPFEKYLYDAIGDLLEQYR